MSIEDAARDGPCAHGKLARALNAHAFYAHRLSSFILSASGFMFHVSTNIWGVLLWTERPKGLAAAKPFTSAAAAAEVRGFAAAGPSNVRQA